MRAITDHKVSGLNKMIDVVAMDEPDQNGVHNIYEISHSGGHRSITFEFHYGPLHNGNPTGFTQQALLAVVIDRLRCFQSGPMANTETAEALKHMQEGMFWMQKRANDSAAMGQVVLPPAEPASPYNSNPQMQAPITPDPRKAPVNRRPGRPSNNPAPVAPLE